MKTGFPLALAAAMALPLLAACGGGARSSLDSDRFVTPLALEPPPIYALLGYSRDLGLTSEQITALDSIAQSAREESRPLVAQLRTTARERSPGFFEITPEAQPVLEEIRAQQMRSREAVGEVLSEEQAQTACRLFQRDRERARGRTAARAPQTPARASGMLDQPRGAAAWPWCEVEQVVTEERA